MLHSNVCQPMTKWYSLMWYPHIIWAIYISSGIMKPLNGYNQRVDKVENLNFRSTSAKTSDKKFLLHQTLCLNLRGSFLSYRYFRAIAFIFGEISILTHSWQKTAQLLKLKNFFIIFQKNWRRTSSLTRCTFNLEIWLDLQNMFNTIELSI